MVFAPASGMARHVAAIQVNAKDLVIARHRDEQHAMRDLQIPRRVQPAAFQWTRLAVPFGVLLAVPDKCGDDKRVQVDHAYGVVASIGNVELVGA